jgi:hypothetical protein
MDLVSYIKAKKVEPLDVELTLQKTLLTGQAPAATLRVIKMAVKIS